MTTPTDMGEFYGLVGAHCEDTLSAEQAARLQTMLLQDAELRRRYVLCLHVQAATERSLAALLAPRGEAAIDAANCLPSAHRAEVGRRRGAGGEGKAASPVLGFLGNLSQIPGFTPALWTIAAILICTLTLACVIAIRGIHVHVDQPEVARSTEQGAGSTVQGAGSNNSPLPPAVPGRMGEGQGVRASSPVARLIHAADCRWAEESDAPEVGDDLAPGRKLVLRSGLAELMFTSGARALLQGPATLEVGSAGSARLLQGRVRVRADTEAAHGFAIHTRTATMIDLGTEFDVQAAADGHSQVYVTVGAVEVRAGGAGSAAHRLGAGQTAQIEPGDSGVLAIIESGDGTSAFHFPTIEPPSDNDYADASQHHAKIRVVEGELEPDSGPVGVLLDGRGQSHADAPRESFFFHDNVAGKILVDLGKPVLVRKINTYSWHVYEKVPAGLGMRDVRATQHYTLYGFSGDAPPATAGDPATHGWTLISRVDTDEFFTVPPVRNRPAQQAVSITGADGAVGRYRFLLWAVRPTHTEGYEPRPELTPVNQNTFFGEFDVYAE